MRSCYYFDLDFITAAKQRCYVASQLEYASCEFQFADITFPDFTALQTNEVKH